MKESEIQKMKKYKQGTIWMQFVMRFMFPIGIMLSCLVLLSTIYMQIAIRNFSVLATFLAVAYLVICILGYSAACELTPKGYSTLQVLFPIEAFLVSALLCAFDTLYTIYVMYDTAYGMYAADLDMYGVADSITFPFIAFIFWLLILSLLWWLPNAIYFKKRESLFAPVTPAPSYIEKYKTWNCAKCGRTNSSHVEECPVCKQKKPSIVTEGTETAKSTETTETKIDVVSNTWVCSKCHTDNSPTLRYCSNCGERQPKENLDIAKTNNSTNTADGLRNKKIVEEKPESTQSKNTITDDGIEIIRPKIIKKEESSPVSPTLDNDFESKKQEPITNDKVDEVQSTDEIAENESAESNEEFAFCRKCGTQLLNDSVFCHKCGCEKVH